MVFTVLLVLVGGIVLLGGGNAIEGFGKDMQSAGQRLHKLSEHGTPAPTHSQQE